MELPHYEIKESTIRDERPHLISQFVEGINRERVGTKYKPMTPRAVAIKLSHIKEKSDLYYFLKRCEEGDSFGKVFFGALKVK
jgi:hypothetical protein